MSDKILQRNVVIQDGDTLRGTPFKGEWIAVPREDFDAARQRVEAAQREQDAKVIPDNWCHPFLTGDEAFLPKIGTRPITPRDVENLLNAIRIAIRSAGGSR